MRATVTVRMATLALAVTFVVSGLAWLASASNARFEASVAAVERAVGTPPVEVSIEPSRIDVVAVRGVRTARTTPKSPDS